MSTQTATTVTERREFGRMFRKGEIWYIRYRVAGHEYQESTRSPNPLKADRLLTQRQTELGVGAFTSGAVLGLWQLWAAGLTLVGTGLFAYRP